MNVFTCKRNLIERLTSVAGDCAATEAEQIMIAALDCSRSFLYAYPDKGLEQEQLTRIESIVARREKGEPLQYIFEKAPFMGFEFLVRPGVLIPRRDTEILVELALPYCKQHRVLDLCTGSGCIGISVAKLGQSAQVAVSDISHEALEITRENARILGADVTVYKGDFLNAIPAGVSFDVILSNPPYIAKSEMDLLPFDVRNFEPFLALEAGEDGLDAYRAILGGVSRVLVPGGYLFFEIGCTQGKAVKALMEAYGFGEVSICKDYGGCERVVWGRIG